MAERSDFSVAMIASLLLHGGILAAVMLARPWEHQLPMGAVVPVNIVSNAQFTDLRAAAQAARDQEGGLGFAGQALGAGLSPLAQGALEHAGQGVAGAFAGLGRHILQGLA